MDTPMEDIMENTKENVVKLLKARRQTFIEMVNIYEENGDEEEKLRYLHRLSECEVIINMLTNQKDFDDYCNIWKEELEEQEQCQKKSS